jgi:hypothetical protein
VDLTKTTGTDFTFKGSNYLNLNCGVYVASTSSNAVKVQDCGGSNKTTYTSLEIAGGISQNGGCNYPAVTGITSYSNSNPWGTNDLTGPDLSTCKNFPTSGTAPITITGSNVVTYQGGGSNGGVVCFTTPVTLGGGAGDNVMLKGSGSGVVYVFENGVTIAGSSNVQFGDGQCPGTPPVCTTTDGGAMREITGGAFNTPGAASTLSIYAPTSGTYTSNPWLNGIAILQPSYNTNTLNLVFGSTSTLNLDGYIYAPSADLLMQDQGGGVLATGMVVSSIDPSSNSSITINSYDQANKDTTLNLVVTLVE